MKKIIVLTLALVFCLGLMTSCKNPNDSFVPAGFKKASNKNADYTLYVPEGWIVEMSTGVTTAYVSERDRSNISFMGFELDDAIIRFDKDGENGDGEAPVTSGENGEVNITTIDQYWDYYSSEFEKTFSDMEYSVNGENLLVSKIAAKKYVYTATVTGQKYKFMQVVTITKGTVYILTYTAHEEIFDSHLEKVEEIVTHIELK